MIKQTIHFTISDDVFRMFPGYVRGVVVGLGVINGASSEELVTLIREAETEVRQKLNLETLLDHPRISAWRDAYRAFGAKPGKHRPSIEAMVRRPLKNEPLPSINALVDIGNVVSMRHLVPAGGHAIDVLATNIELRLARGDEDFTPLDSDQIEHPSLGEIVFVEGRVVLTRRWTWRQGKHTLVVPETNAVEFNVDGLPLVPVREIEEACEEISTLIKKFCGGDTRYEILSTSKPKMKLV